MAQKINVDVTPNLFQQILYYHQGDVGREFEIAIVTKDGYEVPSGATFTIQATKPSGLGFSVSGTASGNVVAFTSTEEMTDEFGRFPAQLKIADGTNTIFTANFLMVGEKNTHPDGTTDGSQETIIPTLTLLVERIEAAAETVDEEVAKVTGMIATATTLPAGSDATANYDSETSTLTFGIPQGEAGAGAAGVTANAYSASKTYAVGDYVIHNSNLYRCTTAITTAESFTENHWTQVVLADDVSDLKSDINATALLPSYNASGNVINVNKASGFPLVAVTELGAETIKVVGANLWDEETRIGNYGTSSGAYSSSGTNLCNANPIRVNPLTEYCFVKPAVTVIVFFYNEKYGKVAASESFIGYESVAKTANSFTTPAGASYMNFYFGSAYGTTYNNDSGINYPPTKTLYEAYTEEQSANVVLQQAKISGKGRAVNVFADEGAITVGSDNFIPDVNANIVFLGGAVRNSGDGWKFIDNAAHTPINCDSVSVDESENLVINFAFTASKVVSFVICPDEYYAKDYTIGASVGLGNAVCTIYHNGAKVNASDVIANTGNFWFFGVMQL